MNYQEYDFERTFRKFILQEQKLTKWLNAGHPNKDELERIVQESEGLPIKIQLTRIIHKKKRRHIEMLIHHGVLKITQRGDWGYTAAHFAVRFGNLPALRKLYFLGFDFSLRASNGLTPLELAQRHNKPRMEAYLQKVGQTAEFLLNFLTRSMKLPLEPSSGWLNNVN